MSKGAVNREYWLAVVVCIIEGREALSRYGIREDLVAEISFEKLGEEIRQEMIRCNEVGLINELGANLLVKLLSKAGDNAEVIIGFLSLLPYGYIRTMEEGMRENNILENFNMKDLGTLMYERENKNNKELANWLLGELINKVEIKGEEGI